MFTGAIQFKCSTHIKKIELKNELIISELYKLFLKEKEILKWQLH